jgi:iron complex outermembrane recepter protein
MSSLRSIPKSMLMMLVLFFGISLAYGQTKQILTWKDSLKYTQKLSGKDLEGQQDEVARIRTSVEFWIRLHPNTAIKLTAAPAQPLNSDQILNEVKLLHEAVEAIIKEDNGQSFDLGMTTISVTAEASPLSPITDSISRSDINDLHIANVTDAVQYLPGLALDRKSSRNQTGIMIRGFDTRQVGLFLDGIPVLVPYDGYADASRFLASDIAVVEVAKGYSSPLLGPNGLGGAVNLVTRQPEKKFEGDIVFGRGSGQMLESGAHIGSRWKDFFFRGGMDWLQTEYFPLSGKFPTNSLQPTYDRLNSDSRDIRYSGRVGWTPRKSDQYVFSYTKQKADYNAPSYAGSDPANNKSRFWQWGLWNRDSYYLNTNTGLGEKSSIKFRAFLDYYPNMLNMFDNASLNTMLNNGSGWSKYNDYSAGFSSEFTTQLIPHNTLSASFFFKGDTHKEMGLSASKNSKTNVTTYSTQPWREDQDYLASIGIQDVITLPYNMRATIGMSADHLNAIWAENVTTINNVATIVPFTCNGVANTSFSSCLANKWTFNPLWSLSYSAGDSGTFFLTFAMKSHFPTLKDRYSYKNGQALPNPTIKPEHSRNISFGYSHNFAFNTMMQLELFRSDVYDAIANNVFPVASATLCPSSNNSTGFFCQQAVNVANEVHSGLELTVRTSPIRSLNLNANYTFLKRTISGPGSMPTIFPTGTPKHRLVSIANLQLPKGFQLQASARYEAGTFNTITLSSGATRIVPASKFATADLSAIWNFAKGMKAQLGVKNLFDRNYFYQEGFPEQGRNWYANTRYEF